MKTFNSVIVRVKDTHDDKVLIKNEHGGDVELKIPLGYSTKDIDDKSLQNNSNIRVKISGEVVGEPVLIKKGSELLYEDYKGFPAPSKYRDGDAVADQMSIFSEANREKYKNHRALSYDPSGFKPSYVTIYDQDIEVRPGDKVYFHYLGYSEDNKIKEDDVWKYYKIPFGTIFCIVRDGEIKMMNGNVFVSPYYGDGYEEIEVDGRPVWGRFFEETQIVESITESPEYLQGIVSHIGNNVGWNSRQTVCRGDRIIFTPANKIGKDDVKDKVEGEEYFTMSQWDIMAKVVYDEVVPVGDYVMIRPHGTILNENRKVYDPKAKTQESSPGQIFLLEDTVKKEKVEEGLVVACGEICQEVAPGMEVRLSGGVYMEEHGVLLVREADIWGVI